MVQTYSKKTATTTRQTRPDSSNRRPIQAFRPQRRSVNTTHKRKRAQHQLCRQRFSPAPRVSPEKRPGRCILPAGQRLGGGTPKPPAGIHAGPAAPRSVVVRDCRAQAAVLARTASCLLPQSAAASMPRGFVNGCASLRRRSGIVPQGIGGIVPPSKGGRGPSPFAIPLPSSLSPAGS